MGSVALVLMRKSKRSGKGKRKRVKEKRAIIRALKSDALDEIGSKSKFISSLHCRPHASGCLDWEAQSSCAQPSPSVATEAPGSVQSTTVRFRAPFPSLCHRNIGSCHREKVKTRRMTSNGNTTESPDHTFYHIRPRSGRCWRSAFSALDVHSTEGVAWVADTCKIWSCVS